VCNLLYATLVYTDELSEQKMAPQQVEEGFRGTLLTSDVSLQLFQESPLG